MPTFGTEVLTLLLNIIPKSQASYRLCIETFCSFVLDFRRPKHFIEMIQPTFYSVKYATRARMWTISLQIWRKPWRSTSNLFSGWVWIKLLNSFILFHKYLPSNCSVSETLHAGTLVRENSVEPLFAMWHVLRGCDAYLFSQGFLIFI